MNLGYKQHFPFNGKATYFEEKIKMGIDKVTVQGLCPDINNPSYMILDAPKIHSIREDLHDRWKPGMKIHHSFGVRTKGYRCFAINECISTQKIEIKVYSIDENDFLSNSYTLIENGSPYVFRVFIDSKMLSEDEINILAKNDGFDSTKDFFRWFNKPFKGKIIHWTNLKY